MTGKQGRLLSTGVIPVIVLDDASRASGVAAALVEGGLPVAEVTLRTPSALKSIRTMSRDERLLVGAGTVVSPEQVDQAVEAAQFVVSPGFSLSVIQRAFERDVPVLPGVVTPSEVMAAMALGLSLLKFFPASAFGGLATLKAFASPFGGVSFVPTGGVNAGNQADYLRLPNVAAVGLLSYFRGFRAQHVPNCVDYTSIRRGVRGVLERSHRRFERAIAPAGLPVPGPGSRRGAHG